MAQTLAVKYRPTAFDDVVEQQAIKIILQQQLQSGEIKNAYLFCGGAGTGKTTCARIFANEINKGQGNPIEMDAASNSGVEDVRNILQQAKTKSLDSEYKVFIIDECHSISNTGWQAFLKLLEEPPAKSIFIFCTTNPERIPRTILSRVQRFDFQRISTSAIIERLMYILTKEQEIGHEESDAILYEDNALEYIAKIADGGMRDAISLMDKCLAFNPVLTVENVVKALGTTDYDSMLAVLDSLIRYNATIAVKSVEDIYNDGKDLKQFVKQFVRLLIDINKWSLGCDWKYLSIPKTDDWEKWLNGVTDNEFNTCLYWLEKFVKLDADIRYSTSVKYDIEAVIILGVKNI